MSHGLFLPLVGGLSSDQELLRDLLAWRLVLPPGAVFTHLTGARLLGWQLPKLPEAMPVFAAVHADVSRPRRTGLICSRLVGEAPSIEEHGLPIDHPAEIALRAARDLGTLDLTILLDSARRLGHLEPEDMAMVLDSGRPGVRMLRTAWELSDGRSESGGETVLRVFHHAIDVPVEPQVTLLDAHGFVVGRADLLVTGTDSIHEYDGAGHRDRDQHTIDLRRERGLAGTTFVRRGYTMDDMINHPLTTMHEIDRALGRPHRLGRLHRWRRLVQNSLYSETGRERILNRWRRHGGFIDWSRTA